MHLYLYYTKLYCQLHFVFLLFMYAVISCLEPESRQKNTDSIFLSIFLYALESLK